jgi:hypothetical protein
VDDTPYRLAYEASVRAIDDQARVLEDLRSRSSTLVAAAALVTSFLGQAAFTRDGSIEPVSLAGLAIGSFIATAATAFVILWPIHVRFSVSAAEIFAIVRNREAAATPVDAREAFTEIATRLELMYDDNSMRIRPLLWTFRSAIVLLSIEVAAWTVALWRS